MKERKAGAQMVLWGSGVNGDWVLWGVEWTRDWSLHWCLTPHMMTHIYSHPVFFLSEMQRLSELDDLCAYLSVKTLLMKIVCFHLYVHYTCRQMQRMQVHSYHFVIWCKSAECPLCAVQHHWAVMAVVATDQQRVCQLTCAQMVFSCLCAVEFMIFLLKADH